MQQESTPNQLLGQISSRIKRYEKNPVPFKEYCLISEMAVKIPYQHLAKIETESSKSTRNQNGNHTNPVLFLLQPNPEFPIPDHLKNKSQKAPIRQQEARQAGQNIIAKISSAWSYYIRMVKGYLNLKTKKSDEQITSQTSTYTDSNVEMAKGEIVRMLEELRNAKYHYEHYTIEGLKDWDEQRRQIEEEQVFTKLLTNSLVKQIEKIDRSRARVEMGRRQAEVKEEKQEEAVEVNSNKKDIKELIDVKGYFQNRKKRLQAENPKKDPISQLQQRRKFNAAVLRYSTAYSK